MQRPLDSASPVLAAANEALVQQLLADRQRDELASRVQAWLRDRLPQGEPGEAATAAAFHLSSRSLHRKLAEQGTGYAELLREVRETLARHHLAQRQHSISEIAYLLGFADASSFTRAFKRWTGDPPSRLRE